MARPAQVTPKGPRDVLSARSLLRSASLQPIIASRSGEPRPKDADDSTRMSHVQYMTHVRSDLTTPLDMYDLEDTSTVAPSYGSHTVDELLDHGGRDYDQGPSVVPYGTYGRSRRYDYRRPPGRRARARPAAYGKRMMLTAPACYFVLKVLELVACVVILVLSRVFHGDMSLDYVYTIFAIIALLIAGAGLLLVWVKGHPLPDDMGHTVMLLLYSIVTPVLLCGGILVLLLSDSNLTVVTIATLFFISTILFTIDITVMASGLLNCDGLCCCCFLPSRPPRIYPNTYPAVHHDRYYYYRHHRYPWGLYRYRHHHHYPYPSDYPRRFRNGYPGYPRTLPQMSVWS